MKPFIKWAGGKRWLFADGTFKLPEFSGKYIEPFLGGAAAFFHLRPKTALLSDINSRLIETYVAVRDDWRCVQDILKHMQDRHSIDYYYKERKRRHIEPTFRAAQFLYLNRTCWNGLYRENLKGEFNVPIGTKTKVLYDNENLEEISDALKFAEIVLCDFEESIDKARFGDLIFVDPPYTTAHNTNGFVKYNQKIFRWDDQVRLRDCIRRAVERKALVVLTNADHSSIRDLYRDLGQGSRIERASVISGNASYRRATTETVFLFH